MNLYAFIASVVGSLAWPVLIAWVIWCLLRGARTLEEVAEIARKYVKTVRVGSLELTLQDARKDAEAVAIQLGKPLGDQSPPGDKLMQLAQINPALAVVEIWKELEGELIKLIQHNGMMRFTRPDHFMTVLADQNKISPTELKLYNRLRKIRNDAVHSREPQPLTLAEVLEYRSFVGTLIERFEKLKSEPGYIDVPNALPEKGTS